MKKKLGIALALFIILGGIYAYDQHKQNKKEEFMTYYNEVWIPIVGEEEKKITDMADKVEELDESGRTQELTDYIKEEALPVAQNGLKQFQDVNPKNKEIKKMNQLAIETDKQRIELLKTLISYVEDNQSEKTIQDAEEKAREKAEETADYAQTLIEKYDLKKDRSDKIYRFEKIKPE